MSIDAKTLLAEAETLRPALLTDRRTLHRNPEAGPVLPHTAAYVKQRLTELGYAPRDMADGVTADITGTDTGRCVLLRTDMDALRIREANIPPSSAIAAVMYQFVVRKRACAPLTTIVKPSPDGTSCGSKLAVSPSSRTIGP